MNSEIIKEIEGKLKKTFEIESHIRNSSQRLHVIATLLRVYDDHWSIDTVGEGLVGQHGRKDKEFNPLEAHEIYSIKRWLRALDLGYFILPKNGDAFFSNDKKYLHLTSVLMDKIETRHEPAKLKNCIRLLVRKRIGSNKASISPKTHEDDVKVTLELKEPFIRRSEIPRTPVQPLSSSSPGDLGTENKDATFVISNGNETYEASSDRMFGHSSTLSEFTPLRSTDNSNSRRSSNGRRSSNDKNLIPTGRQIPFTPVNGKHPSGGLFASSPFDVQNKIEDNTKQNTVGHKRQRDLSPRIIEDYVLDEPESGTVWGNEEEGVVFGLDKNPMDWGATLPFNETFDNLFERKCTSADNKDEKDGVQSIFNEQKFEGIDDTASSVAEKNAHTSKVEVIRTVSGDKIVNEPIMAMSQDKNKKTLPKTKRKADKCQKKVMNNNEELPPRTRSGWRRQVNKSICVEASKGLTDCLEEKVEPQKQISKDIKEDCSTNSKASKKKEKLPPKKTTSKEDFLLHEMPIVDKEKPVKIKKDNKCNKKSTQKNEDLTLKSVQKRQMSLVNDEPICAEVSKELTNVPEEVPTKDKEKPVTTKKAIKCNTKSSQKNKELTSKSVQKRHLSLVNDEPICDEVSKDLRSIPEEMPVKDNEKPVKIKKDNKCNKKPTQKNVELAPKSVQKRQLSLFNDEPICAEVSKELTNIPEEKVEHKNQMAKNNKEDCNRKNKTTKENKLSVKLINLRKELIPKKVKIMDEDILPEIKPKARKCKNNPIQIDELFSKSEQKLIQDEPIGTEVTKVLTNMPEEKVERKRITSKNNKDNCSKKNKTSNKMEKLPAKDNALKKELIPNEMPIRKSTRIQARAKDVPPLSENINGMEDSNNSRSLHTINKILERISIDTEDVVTDKIKKINYRVKKSSEKENKVSNPRGYTRKKLEAPQ